VINAHHDAHHHNCRIANESLAVLKKKFAVTQEWRGTVLRYPFDHLGFRSPTADSVDRVLDARGEGNALTADFKTVVSSERNLRHLCHRDIDELMFGSVVVPVCF